MRQSRKSNSVSECKIQASILLKSFYSEDSELLRKAAKRFLILPEFKTFTLEEVTQADIKRKHALWVIALENGFNTWSDLKCQLPFIKGGFLNHWFPHYEKAKAYQKINEGYLLPYKHQFFVCDPDYINNLGLDANNPDWKLINDDWAVPANSDAYQRLYKQWMAIQEDSHGTK